MATTTLEYALLLALVVMTTMASYQALGRNSAGSADRASETVATVNQSAPAYDGGGGASAPPSGS